jgi:uncharacterized LabA/DUF88 family protein
MLRPRGGDNVKGSNYTKRGYQVGVFLDSSNIHASVKKAFEGKEADHGRLLKLAVADNHLYRAIAYCINMGNGFDRWKQALGNYGFEFREKELQHFKNGEWKGDVDMEIAMDVWRLIDQINMVVLLTGDGDFTELVKRCKELGKVVRVSGVPGSTSHHLVEAANEFLPIDESMLRVKNRGDKKEEE